MATLETTSLETTRAPRRPGHVTMRSGLYDLRVNYRVLLYAAVAAGILLIVAIWAMALGSFRIPFVDVVRTMAGDGSPDHEFIVQRLRLPRVLAAILVGVSLAISGAIFQGLVRNPLVSPDIIGINAGASLIAVFWLVTNQDRTLLPLAAFLGAVLTAGLIYLLAWKNGIDTNRLILVGIGINAAALAGTTYLIVRANIYEAQQAVVWTMGSVYASTWWDVRVLALPLLVLVPAAIALTWSLRVLQLGDDVTRGLGVPLERTRLALVVVGCAFAAIAVAVAGPIAFVALMVPHIARLLAGPLSGSVLILTGVLGALLVLVSDTIAQHFLPVSLPVGVVTSAVGAPYFLYLLYRFRLQM